MRSLSVTQQDPRVVASIPFVQQLARRVAATMPHSIDIGDLVQAKKTQRDNDWPMVSLLVETHYFAFAAEPTPERIAFWLCQARTSERLIELAGRFSEESRRLSSERSLLVTALDGNLDGLRRELMEEELRDRQRDREYWAPLLSRFSNPKAANKSHWIA